MQSYAFLSWEPRAFRNCAGSDPSSTSSTFRLLFKPSSEGHLKDTITDIISDFDIFLLVNVFLYFFPLFFFTSGSFCPRLFWPPAWHWCVLYSHATGRHDLPQRWEAPGWLGNAGWRAGTPPPPAWPPPRPRRGHRTASSRLRRSNKQLEDSLFPQWIRASIGTRIVCFPTCVVGTVFSAAFVDDQTSLEELEEARRLFPLDHQHLEQVAKRENTRVLFECSKLVESSLFTLSGLYTRALPNSLNKSNCYCIFGSGAKCLLKREIVGVTELWRVLFEIGWESNEGSLVCEALWVTVTFFSFLFNVRITFLTINISLSCFFLSQCRRNSNAWTICYMHKWQNNYISICLGHRSICRTGLFKSAQQKQSLIRGNVASL